MQHRSQHKVVAGVHASDSQSKPSFFRFAGSSLVCTGIDQVLAVVLFSVLRGPLAALGFFRIFVASALARCVSLSMNFVLNNKMVFKPTETNAPRRRKRESFPRFLAVAVLILILSTIGVYAAHEYLTVTEWQAKIVMDFALFFLNYSLQRKWVFKPGVTVRMAHR